MSGVWEKPCETQAPSVTLPTEGLWLWGQKPSQGSQYKTLYLSNVGGHIILNYLIKIIEIKLTKNVWIFIFFHKILCLN